MCMSAHMDAHSDTGLFNTTTKAQRVTAHHMLHCDTQQ